MWSLFWEKLNTTQSSDETLGTCLLLDLSSIPMQSSSLTTIEAQDEINTTNTETKGV